MTGGAFDLPRGTIFRVDEVNVRFAPGPHPFVAGKEREIMRNWAAEKKERPALYDGEVALLSSLRWRDLRLVGAAHIVRYSAFLYWRRLRPVHDAEHCYVHAMPVSTDGALIAIRMAMGTISSGLAYFAAGSFEPEDFRAGRIDVEANMIREVREETGLEIAGNPVDPCFHALSLPQGTVLFRRVYLPGTANEIAVAIERYVRGSGDPHGEITGPVVIRSPDDLPEKLAPQMPALIDWHFSTPPRAAIRGAARRSG